MNAVEIEGLGRVNVRLELTKSDASRAEIVMTGDEDSFALWFVQLGEILGGNVASWAMVEIPGTGKRAAVSFIEFKNALVAESALVFARRIGALLGVIRMSLL